MTAPRKRNFEGILDSIRQRMDDLRDAHEEYELLARLEAQAQASVERSEWLKSLPLEDDDESQAPAQASSNGSDRNRAPANGATRGQPPERTSSRTLVLTVLNEGGSQRTRDVQRAISERWPEFGYVGDVPSRMNEMFHHGLLDRVERGVYRIAPKGQQKLREVQR